MAATTRSTSAAASDDGKTRQPSAAIGFVVDEIGKTAPPARDGLADPGADEQFIDELKPGTTLFHGQYTIVQYINSGGFGITYMARDSLERTVVIKECFPGAFCRRSSAIVRARSRVHHNDFRSIVRLFVQEARSLSKLVHPNIVGVHQVFEDNDTAYMAIDYVDGQDLLSVIEDGKVTLSPDQIVNLVKKLLKAIGFVHDSGLLHRDISPDNILVDARFEPVLIDFGAAREQASQQNRALSALRVVKDGYSPQEFYIAGSVQNPSSDLYALAASFYHVISGAPPPISQERLSSLAEGSDDLYQPLAGRFDGYPQGFLEAMDKAVKVLPRDRIQSADAWLEMIENGGKLPLVGDPTGAERRVESVLATISAAETLDRSVDIGVAETVAPLPRRSGGLIMLLGTAAAIALVAGYWVLSGEAEDSALAGPSVEIQSSVSQPPKIIIDVTKVVAQLPKPSGASSATRDGGLAPAALSAGAEGAAERETVLQAEIAPVSTATGQSDVTDAADAGATPVGASANVEIAATSDTSDTLELGADAVVDRRDPAVLADQIAATNWDYQLPFRTLSVRVGGDPNPVVVSLSNDAKVLGANPWMVEGVTIYSVNGEGVADQAAIMAAVARNPTLGDDLLITAPAQIRPDPTAPFEQVTLSLAWARDIDLMNGTSVRAELQDGAWVTTVVATDDLPDIGLRTGDIILSEHQSEIALETPLSFEDVIAFLAGAQLPQAHFNVMRDAKPMIATSDLTRSE